MSQYLNPFLLFRIDAHRQPDTAQVMALAQKLQAHLDAPGATGLVRIGEHSYGRPLIAELLLDWQDDRRREYHRQIALYRKLYNFLEYGHLGLFREPESQAHPLWGDVGFIEFVRPHFERAYTEAVEQAERANDEEALQHLWQHSLPLAGGTNETERDENAFSTGGGGNDSQFEAVLERLREHIARLEALAETRRLGRLSERELLSYLPDKSIEIYNRLPDRYMPLRNQLGDEVRQIAVLLHNEWGRADGAEALVRQGLKLKTDGDLQRSLQAMLAHHHRQGAFRFPLWLLIGLGVMALLFLIQYLTGD